MPESFTPAQLRERAAALDVDAKMTGGREGKWLSETAAMLIAGALAMQQRTYLLEVVDNIDRADLYDEHAHIVKALRDAGHDER